MRKWSILISIFSIIAANTAPAISKNSVITIDDRNVYPESLDSTADGTIYIGGSNGRIYRALSGEDYAEPWILPEHSGLHQVRGVLAAEASESLWVCDNNGNVASLVLFSLRTGTRRASYVFPGGGHCNDISLNNGTAYVTDTNNGRILRLLPGANALAEWYSSNDPTQRSLDGLVWTRDGKLYANTYSTHHLIRIDVGADGSAGKGTVLKTSLDLYQPDGMRLSSDGRILLTEGQGRPGPNVKEGRLDEVNIQGDEATITVIKSGFELPTAVTAVGRVAWVLESKFDYLRNPFMKGKDPGAFHLYAVLLPRK